MSPVPYPFRPMIAVTAAELPVGEKWIYEPKFDGFRCLAHASGGKVRLQSRQLRPLTTYFPEITAAVAELGENVVLDGELVAWHEGRLDFTAMQQRIHPLASRASQLAMQRPAAFVVFDLLASKGEDRRGEPFSERRRRLEKLLEKRLPHGLVLMPMSPDIRVARQWMLQHTASGIEGVVAKRVDQTYRSGGRSWRKVKTRMTAEAVVGGVLGSLEEPEALIVGRRDLRGRLRVSGRTTALSRTARTELVPLLAAGEESHPWPDVIPSARFGQRPSMPVEYEKVRPAVVVELDVDAAYEHERWRHAVRFVRVRNDLTIDDVS
ncbi:RNA ligase family protein [Pseudonocardia halophobica]|uniref:ATP-dependent DNA ligase n=1 Tax=Pseudonocardia halophobica TaxID=29401 RepID=UPI003D9272DB